MNIEETKPSRRLFSIELDEDELIDLREVMCSLSSKGSKLGSEANYEKIVKALGDLPDSQRKTLIYTDGQYFNPVAVDSLLLCKSEDT